MRIPDPVLRWAQKRAMGVMTSRLPDKIVIPGRLYRWHLVRLGERQQPGHENKSNHLLGAYLHLITGDDDDRALHDHPWMNASILLQGAYLEHIAGPYIRFREAGDVVVRMPSTLHRISLVSDRVVSLFLSGPDVREWGFMCEKGWVPWFEFSKRGCGK